MYGSDSKVLIYDKCSTPSRNGLIGFSNRIIVVIFKIFVCIFGIIT